MNLINPEAVMHVALRITLCEVVQFWQRQKQFVQMKKSIKGQGRLWQTSNVPTMDGVLMYRKNVM